MNAVLMNEDEKEQVPGSPVISKDQVCEFSRTCDMRDDQ